MKICKVKGCKGDASVHATARGYCLSHYKRFMKFGDPLKGGRYKGTGSISKWGYKIITVNGKCWIREHRHVMEQIIDRKLKKTEHIHHIDRDKLNNSPDNLQIVSNNSHSKIHASFRTKTHKTCTKCHSFKPRWQFRKSWRAKKNKNHDKHRSDCRDCENLGHRKRRKLRRQS